MKNIAKIILPILIVCCSINVNATTNDNYRPTPIHRVLQYNTHPKIAKHKNVQYYQKRGVWYVKRNNRFVRVKAPAGARVAVLPRNYKVVKRRGVTYYKRGGVYYRKTGRNFIVVNI